MENIAEGGCMTYMMKDVIQTLGEEKSTKKFGSQNNGTVIERKIEKFIQKNPGKSLNAIFNHFKQQGFSHKNILEAYNILMYDQKTVQRLNVGTNRAPRYAHFLANFFAYDPGKDVLYDVLGPV